jgi:hypothetical protein
MKKTFLFTGLVILFVFIFSPMSMAQPQCGFDEKMKKLIANDPQSARGLELAEQSIRNYIATHPPGVQNRTIIAYTIPVVVHVMHTGGAVGTIYNPSDAAILGAINYLNQVYAGTYPGMEAPVEGGPIVNLWPYKWN